MEELVQGNEDRIYIVVTQTGTMLSRVLKLITNAQYNHVSVSLDPTLNTMYSFGRKNPYNPFWGGFVIESPHFGTFKRFSETDSVVLCLPLSPEQKEKMKKRLEDMYQNRKNYSYNTMGLLLAALRIHYQPERSYYCSEFVKAILEEFDLISDTPVGKIPKPVEFLQLRGSIVVYRGKLRLYEAPEETEDNSGSGSEAE